MPIKRFVADESGATTVEYASIAALAGLVLLPLSTSLAQSLPSVFGKLGEALSSSDSGTVLTIQTSAVARVAG